jgi:hypothetical protein
MAFFTRFHGEASATASLWLASPPWYGQARYQYAGQTDKRKAKDHQGVVVNVIQNGRGDRY